MVSRHNYVIENSGDQFKKERLVRSFTEWLAFIRFSWQCYYKLGTNAKLSMPFQVLKD